MNGLFSQIIRVGVPIVFQSLLMRSFGIIDSIMVGKLGVSAIASVSICNQMYSFGDLLSGICGALGVFVAQYYGNKQIQNIKKILCVSLSINFLISVLFCAITIFKMRNILAYFSKDQDVLNNAYIYYSVYVYTYIFNALIYCFANALKSLGKTIYPLIFSILSLSLNSFLNFILIFGNFNFPILGVKGAAYATLIARFIEFILYLICVQKIEETKNFISFFFNFDKRIILSYLKISVPIFFQSLSWAFGTALINFFYANMGTEAFAALNIIWIIEGISFAFFEGICCSSLVIVGKKIGENENIKNIKTICNYLIFIQLLCSLLFLLLINFFGQNVLVFYKVNESTINIFSFMKRILMISIPLKSLNMLLNQGILKAGADTKYTLFAGFFSMWLICVPIQLFNFYILELHTVIIYVLSIFEEISKFIFFIRRYCSNKWITNITRIGV